MRRAALTYDVPKSTLHDRVSGRVLPGATGGAPRYLDDEEEEELVLWLEGCADVGCAKSVREVRAIVGGIVAKKQGLELTAVSHGWWDRFRARHPQLRLRSGESLAYVRAVCSNRVVLDRYFDLLEDVMVKNALNDKPGRIFNLDESGIPLQHRPGRRIAVKGQKHVNVLTSGNKTNITLLACVSASGYALPPMVIYNHKNLSPELARGEVVGIIYGLSSGWIDGELFSEWFRHHFLEYAPAARPLLLLLDGHSSHYCPEFIREACECGVIVFCLPPHTTHISQPLDVSCFHSLKVHWDYACDYYMSSNSGKVVTIYQFSQLFALAWKQAMTPQNIIAGFRATGVFPVNRNAIVLPGEQPRPFGTPTAVLAERKGINFMPFYSPARSRSQFSEEELECFQRRFEEGYDLTHDDRYNKWLSVKHPNHCRQRLPLLDLTSSPPQFSPSPPMPSEPLLPQQPAASTLSSPPEDAPISKAAPRSKLASFLPVPAPVSRKTSTRPTGVSNVGTCVFTVYTSLLTY